MLWSLIALVVASLSTGIGVVAWMKGIRFGRLHHVFYALTIVGVGAAVVMTPTSLLIAATLGLVGLAFTHRGSRAHRMLGLVVWLCCAMNAALERF